MRIFDISLLILSASLGFFLAIYIERNRHAPGNKALSILIAGASIWSLAYAFEILASRIEYKLLWEKVEFFGIVIIPVAWFTFVSQYLGNPSWMKGILKHRLLLGIIPVVTLVLVWTNELHHLVWQKAVLEAVGPLETLDFSRGPWFWVLMIFSYTLLLLGSVKLSISLFGFVRLQRWQVILALLAILLPWIGNLVYISGLSPEHILDWAAFLFLISGVLFSVSLFRYQLVNILPIAEKTVFDGMADTVLVLDMGNNVVEMNPSAQKMIGSMDQDILGKNLSSVMPMMVPYITQAGFMPEFIAEITQGEGNDLQYYDLHISLITDPYEVAIGRLVVLHPITQHIQDQAELVKARDQLEMTVSERTAELKLAIEQLQQELVHRSLAEKRFEDVIEYAPDAMLLLDQGCTILLLNAKAEQLFGYSRNELVGKNIIETLIPEEYRRRQSRYYSKFINDPLVNQSSFGVDLYGMRKDGSEFPIEMDLSRLDISDGFWLAINVHDISDRKKVENVLRESESTYRALFENAGDAIFITGLDRMIMQVNQKAAELLGFSQADLQSLSIFDVTVPEEIADVKEKMERLIRGEHLPTFIRHYIKRNGDIFPCENNTVLVLDVNGKPKYFQSIARDITERIKSEHAQNQLLEEISRSSEQMRDLALRLQEVQELERQELATELHDRVGQNLTGLNLNLKILQNQIKAESSSEVQKRLSDSLLMVEETTHKIRDVMADLNPPVLDEYGLIAAIKWYGGEFASRIGITIRINGDKYEPRLAPSVEKILFRLVQESLNNVAKHSQATEAVIDVESSQEAISVKVKDNGLGFDPVEIKDLGNQPHWGLLSMQQRAASIGANLLIDSTPGKGTEVCVKIRRNQHDD